MTDSLTEWVTRSPIELSWTAKKDDDDDDYDYGAKGGDGGDGHSQTVH